MGPSRENFMDSRYEEEEEEMIRVEIHLIDERKGGGGESQAKNDCFFSESNAKARI